jgi:hypothetical protein
MKAHVNQDHDRQPNADPRPAGALEPPMASQPPPTTPAEAFQVARDSDAPINQRLAAYSAAMRATGSPVEVIVGRLVHRLRSVGAGLNAPRVGEPMPNFLLPDDAAHLVGLEELLANGLPLEKVVLMPSHDGKASFSGSGSLCSRAAGGPRSKSDDRSRRPGH